MIQAGNEQHVHHIILYECHLTNAKDEQAMYEKWLAVDGTSGVSAEHRCDKKSVRIIA